MAIATLPESAKVLVLATERGLLSVDSEIRQRGYKVFEITQSSEIKEALTAFEKTPPDYLVLDSVTKLSSLVLRELQAEKKAEAKGLDLKSWGELATIMSGIINACHWYPSVFVCTCIDEAEAIGEKGYIYGPLLDGKKFKKEFLADFDFVFFLREYKDQENISRVWSVNGFIDNLPGKDRSGRLETYEKPDLSNMLYKMLGHIPGTNAIPGKAPGEGAD
jgi:hypothetical protein